MAIAMRVGQTEFHPAAQHIACLREGAIAPARNLKNDLRVLHDVGVRVRHLRNETIFNEGDAAEYSYKVLSGAVRLCKHMTDGRRQIADFMLEGDLFGFMEFGEHSFTAEAVCDVILISYPNCHIDRLSESTPALRKHLVAHLSEKIAAMQNHMLVLARNTAKERVASFLLRLAARIGIDEGERFDLVMGRQDIADHLGLTIETVCRVISDLKRERKIAVPNLQQLIIGDLDGLQAIADADE